MKRPQGLFILHEDACRRIHGPEEQREIGRHVELLAPPQTRESAAAHPELLAQMEVLFGGWGGPLLDDAFLERAPRLKALFHGAGSLASIVTEAVWERGIVVTSAFAANAVPVAEYTLATILFSLKHGWRLAREVRQHRTFSQTDRDTSPGGYRSAVGLVSLGAVARRLLELLRPFDLDVLVYDPFLTEQEAGQLGVRLASLEELFCCCEVVSLHTPHLAETEGLITGKLLGSMRSGATFINTARALVVHQEELIEVAMRRPDLQYILDVVHPEPPPTDSPLYSLPNIVVTPHIAGSVGRECRRMGQYMVEELKRYVSGQPLRWALTPESIWNTSHRPFYGRHGGTRRRITGEDGRSMEMLMVTSTVL